MDTTKNASSRPEHVLPIREEELTCQGLALRYRLTAVGNEHASHFLISVCTDGERAEIDAGTDLLRALSHFRSIADGRVTPCTLCDVLHDLHYLELF